MINARQFVALVFLTYSASVSAFAPSPRSHQTFIPYRTKSVLRPSLAEKNQSKSISSWCESKIGNDLATGNFIHKFLEAGGGNDPIGTRGEAYFFLQAILIISIVLGGMPVLGDYLQLLAGPGLMVVGVAVLAMTAVNMGESITPWPKPNGQGLVQDGLYAQMRHPMYFGLLSTMAGFSVATGSIQRLLLTLVLYVAIDIKSDYEEEELQKAYPDYKEYQEKVPSKFVPKAWLRKTR